MTSRRGSDEIAGAQTVAIEVTKGSVAVWDGAVWHATGARKVPGARTALHATYQRLYAQPIDDYTYPSKRRGVHGVRAARGRGTELAS